MKKRRLTMEQILHSLRSPVTRASYSFAIAPA